MSKPLFLLFSVLFGAFGTAVPAFAQDTTPPTVAVTGPAANSYLNSLAVITGTAEDNDLVSAVTVSIRRLSDGYYWNGTAFAAVQSWRDASIWPSSWTYSALPAWVDASSYTVFARALDTASNFSAVYSTATFYFDTGLPVSAVTSPVNNSAVYDYAVVSGTAWDLEQFTAQVWVKMSRATDNMYWNGATSQWTAAEAWNLAVGSVAWTYAGPPYASLTAGTTYFAVSRAVDLAGNAQASEVAGSSFVFAGATVCGPLASVQSGLWSDPATWSFGIVPSSCTSVTVAAGHTVTLNTYAAAGATAINGTLAYSRASSATFTLTGGNLTVNPGGTLDLGTEASPIPEAVKATLLLSSGTYAGQYALTVNNGGNFTVRGAAKAPYAYAVQSITTSDTSLQVYGSTSTEGWQVGDTITIGPTSGGGFSIASRTITAITGGPLYTVSWSGGTLPKARTLTPATPIIVANLTRNVLVRSVGTVTDGSMGNTAYISNLARNTTSFMVSYGEFAYLGSMMGFKYSLAFDSQSRGEISSSTFRNSTYGLFLYNSYRNTFTGNNFFSNTNSGIEIRSSSNNTLAGNNFISNGSFGVFLFNAASHNTLTRNNAYSNGSYGIYLYDACNENTLTSNNSFSNADNGINFVTASDNLLAGNNFYANSDHGIYLDISSNNNGFIGDNAFSNTGSGIYLSNSVSNAFTGGGLGYDGAGAGKPDTADEVSFDPAKVNSLELKGVRVNPAAGVSGAGMSKAASYLLSYGQDGEAGTLRLWGNYRLAGSTLTLDYSTQLYASTSTAPRLMRGAGHSITSVVTRDADTLSEIITVEHAGAGLWQVRGSSSGLLGTFAGAASGSYGFSHAKVDFTLNVGAVLNAGDALNFACAAAAGDANTQKKLLFGPGAVAFNEGRSKLELAPTSGVVLRGKADGTANTLVDRLDAASAYYNFVDSGAFTAENSSFTNMASGGIQLSGDKGVALSSSSFDFLGFAAGTNSYITARDLVVSAELSNVVFGLSRSSAGYSPVLNVNVEGADGGLALSFKRSRPSLGELWGERFDYDPNNKVVWEKEVAFPEGVYFDEITSTSIAASAYAPLFQGLDSGLSGVAVARDGAYSPWRSANAWAVKTVMPTGRSGLGAVASGGKIYAIGGSPGTGVYLAKNEVYDPVSNTWTEKAPMPTARSQFALVAAGGKLYAMGGCIADNGVYCTGFSSANEEYDPKTDSWTARAPMPTARAQLMAAEAAGKIYALGGTQDSRWLAAVLSTNEEYDPASNTWIARAPMPTSRRGAGAGALNGLVYVVGGSQSDLVYTLTQNEAFNPLTNVWTARAAMPTSRRTAVAVAGGKVYALGGYTNADYATADKNEEYDPATNAWAIKPPIPSVRSEMGVAVFDGKIYALGASPGPANANEAYDPGVGALFTGLTPNTQYVFKAKARDFFGVETAESVSVSTYTMAVAAPAAGQVFTNIYASSITVSWSSGSAVAGFNGPAASYRVQVSSFPDFSGVSISSATGGLQAQITGLQINTTYYFRVQAYNAVGGTDYSWVVLGSTRTQWTAVPGCSSVVNVSKNGNSDFTGIREAVNALPHELSGNACVVLRDTQTYSEEVTVQGFSGNGYRVMIMADPASISSAPVVSPPALSTAAFRLLNDSVTVQGINIVPSGAVAYGILSSSADVTVSSVSVFSGINISAAGISLSSRSVVSNSTVTVQAAYGLRLTGDAGVISQSAIANDAAGADALDLYGASYSQVSGSLISNPSGRSVYISSGSHHNVLSQNKITSYANSPQMFAALYIRGSSSNTVTGADISNLPGVAAYLGLGADHNTISQSTMTSLAAGYQALRISGGSYNAVTRSLISSQDGYGLYIGLNSGSDHNTVSQSTITSNSADLSALYIYLAASNTVTASVISNPSGNAAYLWNGADGNTISLSSITSNAAGKYALLFSSASSNTVTQCYISNPPGYGLQLIANSGGNLVSLSTITVNSPYAAFGADNSAANTLLQSHVSNPSGYGGFIGFGADGTYIGSTTFNSGAAAYFGLKIVSASSNTVSAGYISNPAGVAYTSVSGGQNLVRQSTVTSGAAGYSAVFIDASAEAAVEASYIRGADAVFVRDSTGTRISDSALAATNPAGVGLRADSNNGVAATGNTISAGGTGLLFNYGNLGTLVVSSNTVSGASYGLVVDSQAAGAVLQAYGDIFGLMRPGATAIYFLGGTFVSDFGGMAFNGGNIGVNVDGGRLAAGSRINMVLASGPWRGAAYELDPGSYVDWSYAAAAPPAGCGQVMNVKQDGTLDYVSIQAAVNGLSRELSGAACVVVRDTGTYAEQVAVRDFNTNGHRLKIMPDPAFSVAAPVLRPPAASTAAFVLAADSVTVQGFRIEPQAALAYGIYSSSASLSVFDVDVNDAAGDIFGAGLRFGGPGGAVSGSTVAVNSALASGLFLDGASSAAVRNVLVANSGGGRALVLERSSYSYISASRFSGSGFNGMYYGPDYLSALRLKWSVSNTIENCFIENTAAHGVGASLESSDYNTIAGSTVSAVSLVVNISNSSGNAVTGSSVYGGDEMLGIYLQGGSWNRVEGSTVTCSMSGVCLEGGTAVIIEGGTNAAVRNSYLHSGYSAAAVISSPGTLLESNHMAAGSGAGDGVVSFTGGNNTLIASNTITGLQGISVNSGAETLALYGNTITGAQVGVQIAALGTDLQLSSMTFRDLLPGATAVNFGVSSLVSTFSFVNFESTAISVNVNSGQLQAGSRVTMLGYFGSRAGGAYENDPAGYVDWSGSDITPPLAAVSQPPHGVVLNSLVQLAGTAADNAAVSSVTVSILRQDTGLYWDGAAWSAGQTWLDAALAGGAWTYSTVPAWVDGSSFAVTARSVDSAGIWSPAAVSVFSYDITAPLSAVLQPGSVQSTTFTYVAGTASDALGVAGVMVNVRRLSDFSYWDGGAWSSTAAWNLAAGTTSWLYTGVSSSALSDGATYQFLARAFDLAGNVSDPYAMPSTFTFIVPPEGVFSSAPFSGIAASSLSVNWGTTFPAGKLYYVRLSTHAGSSPYVASATTTASAYGFTGLLPNAGYYGFVSTMSAVDYMASGAGVTLPVEPSSAVFTSVAYSSAALGWDGGINPAGTVYQYEISASSSFLVVASSASGTAAGGWLTGLAQNTTYYGRVRAYNSAGAPTANVYTAPALTLVRLPLGLPSSLAGSPPGGVSMTWSWKPGAVINSDYLAVYADGVFVATVTASAPGFYIQTGLTPNTSHQLGVAGRNVYGEGPLAVSSAVFTLAAVPPGLSAAQIFVSSAQLTWGLNGNSGGTAAQLWRSMDNAAFDAVFDGGALTYTDAALQECSTYYYKVRNRNGGGLYTPYGGTIQFATRASTPTPPSGLYAEALEGARIALNWDLSPWPGVTQYDLYYDNASGAIDYGTPFAVFSSTVSSWTTPALTPGGVYKFSLRARNRCGIEEKNLSVLASAQAVGLLSGVRAAIKAPQTGKKIKGNSVTVVAEIILGLPSQIKQVRFQYRASGAAAWTSIAAANVNHPNPDTESPYFTHWDADAMAPGAYELRALATDIYNSDDPAPPTITVVIDPVEYDTSETVVGGEQQKEQKINNAVTSTVQAADEATALVSKVIIPAGAVNVTTAALTLVSNPAVKPVPPEGSEELSLAVKINLSNGQSQLAGGNNALVTLSYKDDNGDGIVDGTNAAVDRLKMYSAPDGGGDWTEMVSSLDREKKTISGVTSHFSFFSVFSAPAASLGVMKAFPNPWQPGTGGKFDAAGVTFNGLPVTAKIKIFTLLGELVRMLEVTAADTGTKVWDGRNMEGHKAASGVYIVLVKSGRTERTFKVAVER